jgi:hypothetical protein
MDVQAWLCDYAQVAGGKLFVSGAAINLLRPAAIDPLRVPLSLALLVTIPWTATNQRHKLTIELIPDSPGAERVPLSDQMAPGQNEDERGMVFAQFNAGRSPAMEPGEDSLLPIALPFAGLHLPGPGAYAFEIRVDGTHARRIPFRVEMLPLLIQTGTASGS